MNVEKKTHIRRNIIPLVRGATRYVQKIVDTLKDRNLLTEEDISVLNAENCIPYKAYMLFKIITEGDADWFEELLVAAKTSGAKVVCNILEAGSKQYEQVNENLGYHKSVTLGCGSKSNVYLGEDRNLEVAVKRLDFVQENPTEMDTEIKGLLKLQNDHVLEYFGTYVLDNNFLFISMELALCNLDDIVEMKLIKSNGTHILKQCAEGLKFLHNMGIVHKAVKPTNIHLTSAQVIKLGDYGYRSLTSHDEESLRTESILVRGWLAPEILECIRNTNSDNATIVWKTTSDVFSLGCICFFVLQNGKHPFGEKTERESNIMSNNIIGLDELDDDWKVPINSMISQNSNSRLKINYFVATGRFPKQPTTFRSIQDCAKLATNEKLELTEAEHKKKQTTLNICNKRCIKYKAEDIVRPGVSNVFIGTYNNIKVAVKFLTGSCSDQNSLSEINMLLKTIDRNHTNVVKYYHAEYQNEGHILLALELCNCTLEDWVCNTRIINTPSNVSEWDLLKGATEGLQFLHGEGIIHRDLKPSNILLKLHEPANVQATLIAKIADFSISRDLEGKTKQILKTYSGTVGWRPAEIIRVEKCSLTGNANKEIQTVKLDIFALGCVYVYTLTKGKKHPFDYDDENILNNRSNKWAETCLSVKSNRELIQRMLSGDQVQRPLTQLILKHPIFWSNTRALSFLVEISNFVEDVFEDILKCRKALSNPKYKNKLNCIDRLQNKYVNIAVKKTWCTRTNYGWVNSLDDTMYYFLLGDRKIQCSYCYYIMGLIRVIRNHKGHFEKSSFPVYIRNKVGFPPNEFWDYWNVAFPRLLEETYYAFEPCKVYPQLADFYYNS